MPSTVKVRIHGARNLNLAPHSNNVYTTVTLGGHADLISEYDDDTNPYHGSNMSINMSAGGGIGTDTGTAAGTGIGTGGASSSGNTFASAGGDSESGMGGGGSASSGGAQSSSTNQDYYKPRNYFKQKSKRNVYTAKTRTSRCSTGTTSTSSSRGAVTSNITNVNANTNTNTSANTSTSGIRNVFLGINRNSTNTNNNNNHDSNTGGNSNNNNNSNNSSVKWEDDNEFRFEVVDDTILQDEPLIFKVMKKSDHGGGGGGGTPAACVASSNTTATNSTTNDSSSTGNSTTGANDGSIGLVYIDLNPLLMKSVIQSQEKDDEEKEKKKKGNDNYFTKQTVSVAAMRKIEEEDFNNSNSNSNSNSNVGGGDETDTPSSKSLRQRSRSRSGSLSLTPTQNNLDTNTTSSTSINITLPPPTTSSATRRSTSSGGGGTNAGAIHGWFPIYDPLDGVRGELELSIKLNFIDNINPFRDSSAGVQLFPFSSFDPHSGYVVQHVFGFVEELVVADDPEFELTLVGHHQGYINNNKNLHEKRQTLMYLLDSSVRRRMCKKVQEMGGNAVLGYYQSFDMEGDSGIVARTYGTCVLIEKKQDHRYSINASLRSKHSLLGGMKNRDRHRRNEDVSTSAAAKGEEERRKKRENDDDDDIDDGGGSDGEESNGGKMILKNKHHLSEAAAAAAKHREIEQDEVQLLTIKDFGRRVRVRIGGLVTARSVKYLGKLASKLSDQDTRDGWWQELRDEIKSHAKTLCCSHVIGYAEASTIHDDVIVLSLTGTAATVRGLPDLNRDQEILMALERKMLERNNQQNWNGQLPDTGGECTPGGYSDSAYAVSDDGEIDEYNDRKGEIMGENDVFGAYNSNRESRKDLKREKREQRFERRFVKVLKGKKKKSVKKSDDVDPLIGTSIFRARPARPCSYCHVPYHHKFAPFANLKLCPCLLCGKKWVPEVILATMEPPARLPVRGSGVLIQARVCRTRSRSTGESDALAVSEALPFLEYEIARQLMLKLKVLGRNAAFSLKSEIDVGSQLIVGK
jgi:hypothetical protein